MPLLLLSVFLSFNEKITITWSTSTWHNVTVFVRLYPSLTLTSGSGTTDQALKQHLTSPSRCIAVEISTCINSHHLIYCICSSFSTPSHKTKYEHASKICFSCLLPFQLKLRAPHLGLLLNYAISHFSTSLYLHDTHLLENSLGVTHLLLNQQMYNWHFNFLKHENKIAPVSLGCEHPSSDFVM